MLKRGLDRRGYRQSPRPDHSRLTALSVMAALLTTAAFVAAGFLGLFHGLSQGGMVSFIGFNAVGAAG